MNKDSKGDATAALNELTSLLPSSAVNGITTHASAIGTPCGCPSFAATTAGLLSQGENTGAATEAEPAVNTR